MRDLDALHADFDQAAWSIRGLEGLLVDAGNRLSGHPAGIVALLEAVRLRLDRTNAELAEHLHGA